MLITVPTGPAAGCGFVAGRGDCDEIGGGGGGFPGGGGVDVMAGMQAVADVIRLSAIIINTVDFAATRRKFII